MWRRPLLAAGAASVVSALSVANLWTHRAKNDASANDASSGPEDWRKSVDRTKTFRNKLSGVISHYLSAHPPIPEWEKRIAGRTDLVMHPQVSRLATSAADGLILRAVPRVYAPDTPVTDAMLEACKDEEARVDLLAKRRVSCVWHFGSDGVGHVETVHGGAIALAFDESFGHAFMSLRRNEGFTAYLHVNYRRPLPTGQPTLINVEIDKIDGRKVFMKATLSDGASTQYCDSHCLFVTPRNSPSLTQPSPAVTPPATQEQNATTTAAEATCHPVQIKNY